MARIRTIKPEFPQSESMGKISRDARLCFVMLWTIADDAGRLRGASRMLASLLFPYDDDAPKLIDGWLAELEAEGCIARYLVDGAHYVEIANWLDHQKIDRPSKSNIPPFDEGSRIIASPREPSSEDLRTKDQGPRTKEGTVREDAPLPFPDPADHAEAIRLWNEMASECGLPRCDVLNATRKRSLAKRLAECAGLDGWRYALAQIRGSPFLLGENDRGWRADIDFVLTQSKFTKLMEGGYDRSSRVQGANAGGLTGFAAVAAELASGRGDGWVDPATDFD
jgi:hypothetical protein